VILGSVGRLAGIDWFEPRKRTILLLDEADRKRPVLVDVPADLVTRFDARRPPYCCRDRDRVAFVDRRLVLDLVGQSGRSSCPSK
jgi:hypothetical protein